MLAPVAAGRNVPLRTFPKRVRRDADRSVRDARAPQFTRELEELHPDNRHVKDNPVNEQRGAGSVNKGTAGIRQQLPPSLPSSFHSGAASRLARQVRTPRPQSVFPTSCGSGRLNPQPSLPGPGISHRRGPGGLGEIAPAGTTAPGAWPLPPRRQRASPTRALPLRNSA